MLLCVILASSPGLALAQSEQRESVMSAEIARVRRHLEQHPDEDCVAAVRARQDAHGALRIFYYSLPREQKPLFGSRLTRSKGPDLPPRLSQDELDALDAFVEASALHAARCAPELPDAGEQAMSFWIEHTNSFIFRMVDPDLEERMFLGHVLDRSLDARQEQIIMRMMAQLGGPRAQRSREVLAELLAREHGRDLELRLERLTSRIRRDTERVQSYVLFLVGLTLFALILVYFGASLRPGFARVSFPRMAHPVLSPYKMRSTVGDAGGELVSWERWRRQLARFALRFGVAGASSIVLGVGVIHHAFGVLGSERGFVELLVGWALAVLGVALLTHRLWYHKDIVRPAAVSGIESVLALDQDSGVLDVLEHLYASHLVILIKCRAWLSFEPDRDPLQRGVGGEQLHSVGKTCAMLWKGMMRMRHHKLLPPLDYTQHIGSAYASSKDEWGDVFEAYWDALIELDASREHLDAMQRSWDARHWWGLGFRGASLEEGQFAGHLTRAMLTGRRWRFERWWGLFFSRDVVHEQASQLVWVAEQGASQVLFWVDESLECVTPDGEVVHIVQDAHVRLANVADLSPAEYVIWGEHLADHEFMPCVHQLDRYIDSWEVPGEAKWLIVEEGEERFELLPRASIASVQALGTFPAFGVTLCGYDDGEERFGLAVMPSHGHREDRIWCLSELPPVLFAELCFLRKHGVSSRWKLEAHYEGTDMVRQ